jgi:transcriptional regulator NrdR family protein
MIACPKCRAVTHAIDTRYRDDNTTMRRRVCEACKHRVTTLEVIVENPRQVDDPVLVPRGLLEKLAESIKSS